MSRGKLYIQVHGWMDSSWAPTRFDLGQHAFPPVAVKRKFHKPRLAAGRGHPGAVFVRAASGSLNNPINSVEHVLLYPWQAVESVDIPMSFLPSWFHENACKDLL